MSAPHTEASLSELIKARFIGVEPDSQDCVLEDADWQVIIDALTALAEPVAYRWHWSNFPNDWHYAGSFAGTPHAQQVVEPLFAKATGESA